jgi:hypothetical protein
MATAEGTGAAPRYRIEHRPPRRQGRPPASLAEADGMPAAMAAAREQAERLRAAGEHGHVAVVDRRHGYDVHVRAVRPRRAQPGAD